MTSDRLITVDRQRFKVKVWVWNDKTNRWQRRKTYPCTIGAVGFTTPGGPYLVVARSRTPAWKAPDWADPEVAGKTFQFDDPRNPFEGGFISLAGHPSTDGDGVGFHGTKFDPQVGTRSSHGCIRLRTKDLLNLYDRAPIGTLVFVE